jgi:colanic acid biosynthesis glycosyl transferase WcaI
MLPLQQGDDYSALLADADVCFITQQAESGNSFFPSKLLGLLAFAKPVVTVAASQTELALSLEQGGFGINVTPGQPAELAKVLDQLAVDPERLNRFGSAGREYVRQFEKEHVLNDFARQLEALVASAS